MAPVELPAGGSVARNKIEICRGYGWSPLFAGASCSLKSSPLVFAPTLRTLKIGTPLTAIRTWESPEGAVWMQVKVASNDSSDSASSSRRGWIYI